MFPRIERESKKKSAAIFDFDGTIANTEPPAVAAFNQFASQYQIESVMRVFQIREKVYSRIYNALNVRDPFLLLDNLRVCYRLLNMKEDLKKTILDAIEVAVENLQLEQELKELFDQLAQSNILIGIVTTNRKETVTKFLVANKIDPATFCFIESACDKRLKLRELIEQHNLNARKSFYIGDQASDINSAKNVMGTIAVTWGYDSEGDLKAVRPNFTVSHPSEIFKILKDCHVLDFEKECCVKRFCNP